MTFRELSVGQRFQFAGRAFTDTVYVKTGARTYKRPGDPTLYNVSTVNVLIRLEPVQ